MSATAQVPVLQLLAAGQVIGVRLDVDRLAYDDRMMILLAMATTRGLLLILGGLPLRHSIARAIAMDVIPHTSLFSTTLIAGANSDQPVCCVGQIQVMFNGTQVNVSFPGHLPRCRVNCH